MSQYFLDRLRVEGVKSRRARIAFSEIIGRSYGGGVLELEPNEVEKLLLPPIRSLMA